MLFPPSATLEGKSETPQGSFFEKGIRMGSKSKKNRQTHPNVSFEVAVAIAVQRALKGEIAKYAQEIKDTLGQDLRADFGSTFRMLGVTLETTIAIVQEKTGITEDEFNTRKLDTEDKLDNFLGTTEAAKEGDRIRFQVKDINSKEEVKALKLDNLGAKPAQLHGDLENHLVGMKQGDVKTVEVSLGDEGSKKQFTFELTMKRVSNKIKTAEDLAAEKALDDNATKEVKSEEKGSEATTA